MVTKTVGTDTKGTENIKSTYFATPATYVLLSLFLNFSNATLCHAAPAPPDSSSLPNAPTESTTTVKEPDTTPQPTSEELIEVAEREPSDPDNDLTEKNQTPFNPNAKFPQSRLNTIPEDENSLRLLEIHIGKYKLDDLVVAYQIDDMVFIPLGFFSELIDLAVTSDPESGIARGFIFREDNLFHLDVKRGEITINGKLTRFNKQQAALRQFDDIYIDSNLLGKWLPLKLDIDLFSSRLKILSDKPLPFEQRKLREEKIKIVQSRMPKNRGYPKQEFPHEDWTYPLINQSARIGIQRDANEDFKGTFGYTTYATADLINMESSWYLSGTDKEIVDEARLTLSKHDPTGTLLGSMRATEYAFGHIDEPRVDLITQPLDPQIGVLVSNYPLTRQIQYDSHNFRGDLPPGWEVELYRNNSLLGYIANSDNGQYQFDDIPLLFGTNYFRLVFYGPQGQRREETHNFNLDRSLSEPGNHYYRAIASQAELSGNRLIAEYDFGLNKNISLGARFASIPLADNLVIIQPEENHNYISAGLRGFHKSLFYRSDFVFDMQSGSATDWEIQTRLGSFIIDLGETYFQSDYISEAYPETTKSIQRRTELKIDTAIPASFLPRIPVNFEIERKSFEGNLVVSRYSNRISMQQHGMSISNTLNRSEQTDLPSLDTGNFQVSRRAFGYNFRGSMSYELAPETELSATTFTMDGIKLWDYFIATGISHINRSSTNEIFLNMSRSRGSYALGVSSRYSTGGILTVDLTFTMGLAKEPRSKTWRPEFRPIASQGSMSLQTFIDNNQNGIRDIDEKGIEKVSVNINDGKVNQVSDENGIIFITGVEPYREIDVDIFLESLDNPLWQPAVKGKRVSLRPGYTAQINFPIIITGEIDGTAYVQFGEDKREVSGVVVELIDLDGKVIQTAKTAYDGFYLMDKIPAGKYQLRVSREQTDSLNLLPVQPTFVVIEPGNPIVNGMDFVLEKRGQ